MKKYEFWSTQPVPKFDENITTNEAIDKTTTKEEIRKEPYSLPEQVSAHGSTDLTTHLP